MRSTPTTTITTSAPQTGSGNSPCGCQEQTPSQPCCCNLVCFDRPNYFCGHLLTDADLTLQQKYVVEKNKLYHRTMDGYGIVCGLKLTCDCDCKGHILVHDGFAIDDCGNDLVVCETTRFDVIHALRCKGLLVTEPPEDDCEPRRHRSRCDIKQCFYITICYDETESEYETPFQSSCTSGPKQCMPTRTHEGVRFDITDKLPHKHSYLDDLERRINECFEVNCDSPVGVIMERHLAQLQSIMDAKWADELGQRPEPPREWLEPCELFCTLKAYFLNHLKTKPDQFNCNLFDEVSCLTCPREYDDDYEERRERPDEERQKSRKEARRDRSEKELAEKDWLLRYREELRESFGKLIFCMQRYQYDCVLGHLIFSCQQPCEAHCLVLGTVEVLNGKLVRVCNTPRSYLWAPANLLQVLIYDIMTRRLTCGEGCEDKDRDRDRKVCCCPDYRNFDAAVFLKELELSACGRKYAAQTAIKSVRAFADGVHNACDFTDSMAFSPAIFESLLEKMSKEGREKDAEVLGIRASVSEVSTRDLSSSTPWQAFQSSALVRRGDAVVGYKSPEGIRVLPDFLAELSPNRLVGQEIEKKLELAQAQAEQAAQQVIELRAEVEALKKSMGGGEDSKKSSKKTKEE